MFENYLKIAWRNLTKKKGYTFINISGLAVGMACCMIIFLFVYDELSYDTYHEHGDRIYQVIHGSESAADSEFWVWNNAPIGPAMANEFPEIEKVVQFSGKADILLRHGEITHQEDGVFFMDSTVFDVFSWNFIDGDPKTALVAPYSIVLTESAAKKYFGNEEALGKTLEGRAVAGRAEGGDYTVTGIIEDIPSNSHFHFNVLLSLSTFHKSIPQIFDMWGYADFYTYIKVNEQFNRQDFERKIPDFMSRITTEDNAKYTIRLVPLEEVYLKSEAQQQPGELGSLSNIYIFSIIGLFIIVIAIINFINLSTARSMDIAKEVGIRKSIGADRKRLIFQFMGESVIIVFLSLIAAMIIFSVASPGLTDLTG
ncbi:MAG TPA: ABC transporter permease, partial [Anditalea sp.]|nr:ABC transporter permease [Anditalea sp.]